MGTFGTLAAIGALTGVAVVSLPAPALAEPLLEAAGTIVPAEDRHGFEATSGSRLTITLASDVFDPVLVLFDAEGRELASNDDFGASLNSRIIVTIPEDGTYTAVAKSFSGDGGDYTLVVRPSSPYEVAYGDAQALAEVGDYGAAIASYTTAIEADPEQPSAYLGRAEARLGLLYRETEVDIAAPEDIPPESREAIIVDFEAAANLIEAQGNADWAGSLREQVNYLRTASPETTPDF